MIDLCIDARMAFSSGIGTCIRELVPYFNHPPFRPILLVDQLDQPWCKGLEQVAFPAQIYSMKEQLGFPAKIPRCDLFWSPHYNVPLLPIHAKKRVVTIHDACHLAFGNVLPKIYAQIVMRKAFHHSDAVITDSEFSKRELNRFLGVSKRTPHVIPVAVNHDHFQRVTNLSRLNEIRTKYKLPDAFILFVGNLKPNKNLDRLARAFSQAFLPGKSLVIVGKGTAMKNTLCLNHVPNEDLAALYSLAELFVFPSLYEGFGLPPLEAMSCGCPTAVSNAASIPEVCGDATVYFHPECIDEIAAAMAKVVNDEGLKKKLVQQGFERVKLFSWRRAAECYRKVFEEVHQS